MTVMWPSHTPKQTIVLLSEEEHFVSIMQINRRTFLL